MLDSKLGFINRRPSDFSGGLLYYILLQFQMRVVAKWSLAGELAGAEFHSFLFLEGKEQWLILSTMMRTITEGLSFTKSTFTI